jgi:ADP-heptose:LPS heptosyltransferase
MGQEPSRVLFVTTPHLGDAVMASPFGAWLRAGWPSARIEALTGPAGVEILRATGAYDRVSPRPEGALGRLLWSLRTRRAPPDVAVFCYSHRGLLRALRRAGARQLWVVQGDRPFPGADRESAPQGDEREVPDALARLLVDAGLPAGSVRPDLRPSEADRRRAGELAAGLGGPAVALHPGSSSVAKQWPIEGWRDLAVALQARGFCPVWIGTKGQADPLLGDTPKSVDLCGAFSPLGTAAFLSHCRALVTGDSGPMHLAGAVGCPVVGLFGPTSARKFRPWGDGHQFLQARCERACGGVDACRGECMRQHSVAHVLEALGRILA